MKKEYFGVPGHCFDIDGYLWHEPGTCNGVHFTIEKPCCGYKDIPFTFKIQDEVILSNGLLAVITALPSEKYPTTCRVAAEDGYIYDWPTNEIRVVSK